MLTHWMSESTPLLPAHNASSLHRPEATPLEAPPKSQKNGTQAKLGTFEGVFLPTTLNVLSILMFLRFGFIIGQMGILGSLLLLVMSYVIDILTVLSVSAISTNGTVRGGGAYYMISRSLGPEFGGAIGVIFFIGQILNASLNVVGFIEPLLVNFGKAEGDVLPILPVSYMWQLLYSTVVLLICTSIALVGATLVSRTAFWLFILLTSSTLLIPLSALIVKPGCPLSPPNDNLWYSGLSWQTLQDNLWPHFTSGAAGSLLPPGVPETFKNLFGIFFPATAGIFAGASMSGELKNPSRSIPRGTLCALALSFVLYFLVIVSLGASVPRELFYKDIKIIQTVSINGLIIIIGEVSTSIFSVIMGVVGAATVLNAIAADKIVPGLSCFSTYRKPPKEKRRAQMNAILFTWLIAQAFLFADINQIATFITMAFLMTFLVTNLACFLLRVGSAPNFRPSFKYFNSKTAFTGGLVSVMAMYLVDGVSATSVIVFLIFLIMVIHYSTPPLNFGDISQLLIYHQVRKYLLRLKLNMSVKYWRPQILLLCDNPRTCWNLIAFCNHLKKGGLYILGHVVLMSDDSTPNGEVSSEFNVASYKEIQKQKNAWTKLRDMAKIKAFVQIAIGPSLPWGVRNVYLGSGLGGMRPNITVLGFYDSKKHGVELPLKQVEKSFSTLHLPTDECRKERQVSVNQWVQIVEDLMIMQATVAVAANFLEMEVPTLQGHSWLRKLSKNGKQSTSYIDLYPIQMSSVCLMEDGKSVMSTNFDTYTLILQLGSILSTVDEWEKNGYKLRIIVFVENASEVEDESKRLKDLLASLRIDAKTIVKCFEDGSLTTYNILVKGYRVNQSNQTEFNHISDVLHSDQWWTNLCDARESLRQIERQKLQRKMNGRKLKSINIGEEKKYDPVLFDFSKSGNSPITGPSLKNNRRYTLSNLHDQGLSLSLNMISQGGNFFDYDPEDSSDSETEGSGHSSLTQSTSRQRTPDVQSTEPNLEEQSPNLLANTNPETPSTSLHVAPVSSATQQRLPPQRDTINLNKASLLTKYKSSLGAQSTDQLSVKSAMSNLRPNFLSVKIPQSKVRDEEDEEEVQRATQNEEDQDDANIPLIQFIEDEQIPEGPSKAGSINLGTEISRNESFLNFTATHKRPPMMRAASIIANDDIKNHIRADDNASDEDDPASFAERDKRSGTESPKKLTLRQLLEELKNLTFNDLPAKGQHIILNELMNQVSGGGKAAVIFSTLPAPAIGTHLDDEASLDYTNSLAIWLHNLPPTLLINSQTVTVTTNL